MTWKKIILIVAGSFVVSFVSYFIYNRFISRSLEAAPAALYVESLGKTLTVVLDNTILGKTPFRSENLKPGNHSFVLTSEAGSFRTPLNLVSGVITVVNWNLGPAESFSEGEIIWMETGSQPSLAVFGSPNDAIVSLDGASLGSAPVSSDKVSPGDHTVKISRPGFKSRTVKVKIQQGYELSVKYQLFLIPGTNANPTTPFPEEPRFVVTDYSSDNQLLYNDTKSWARGLVFFFDQPDSSVPPEKRPDYYFDDQGNIFDHSGFGIAPDSQITPKESLSLGYLGQKSDGGITATARKAILAFAETALVAQAKVVILPTGTGWLRVRSSPSLSGEEVEKINVGDQAVFLSEEGSWYQIKLSDGKTGWISAAFAKKL